MRVGGRKGGGRGSREGGLRDPSLTLPRISPPESHPAELGDFQRQFLLTSQLSWASGLLIRLVNTTRTSRGGGGTPQGPLSHPPQRSPLPRTAFLWAGTFVQFAACSPHWPGSPSLQVCVPCCLSLPCPSLSLSVPVQRRGKQGTEPALTTCLWGLGPAEQRMNRRKGGGWGPWRPQL